MPEPGPSPAHWTSGWCEANGVRLHFLRTGLSTSRGGPTLVALHGLSASGACWTPLARALQDGWEVLMPDARGHGQSSAPAQGYRYHDHAGDVLGLISALGLDHPVLLGHSMGGLTAAVVASQAGSALRGVILADPTFISPEWQREVFESDVAEQHRQLLATGRADALAQAQRRHPHRSPELTGVLVEARFQTHPAAFEVLTPPNPEYRDLIRRIRCPTLLVTGSRGIVSLETARELQALNPLLRHEQLPHAGHGLPYDQPEQLGALVRSFLQSLRAGEGPGPQHSR